MKILITGGGGQVAYELKRLLTDQPAKNDYQILVPTRDELSIDDFKSLDHFMMTFKPDIVINTAAFTQVDKAEQETNDALAANFYGVKNLGMVCRHYQCPLIHLSTDYVFDGNSNLPYLEHDLMSPINVYGETKWRGENFLREYCDKFMILRVSAVFSSHGTNFVKTMLRLAREKSELRVVADQVTCPTSAASIAEVLLQLCENPKWGVFHYCGAPAVSWYDFAKSIIETASRYEPLQVKNIQAITTEEYPTLAKRPRFSVLNCEKIKNEYGILQPDWKAGLENVIKQLCSA